MTDAPVPKATSDLDYKRLKRDELLALLRDVTEQRDKVLSQYEAMALQLDESTREIDDAQLSAQQSAKRAEESEHRAEREAARANELSRELNEERRKRAEIAAQLVRPHNTTEHNPVEDPWGALWRAVSQIGSEWIAWLRSKIPQDSSLLPWFDRVVELAKSIGRFALKLGQTVYEWIKPHVVDLWKRLKHK